jgi:hypothetical protein
MKEDSSLLSGAAASRKKRDIIGELLWQYRSIIVVLCTFVVLCMMITSLAPLRNWFEKFFILLYVGFVFLVHAYWLVAWSIETVIARFRGEDSTPPELD